MTYEVLALDVDGTLLDDAGVLPQPVREAVTAARDRGVRVVLCTGRRYRTAAPIAEALGLDGPIVAHNGALVRDLASGAVLEHRLLPLEVYEAAYELMAEVGGPLAYLHEHPSELDFCFEGLDRAHPFQREYLDDYGHNGLQVSSLATPPGAAIIMLSLMADEAALQPLYERATRVLGDAIKPQLLANRMYRGSIFEIASARAGKWPALEALAAGWGIPAKRIMAIGDDRNDIEMIEGAGLGIAMGNASAAVRDRADWVAQTNVEHGAARAIEEHLLSA